MPKGWCNQISFSSGWILRDQSPGLYGTRARRRGPVPEYSPPLRWVPVLRPKLRLRSTPRALPRVSAATPSGFSVRHHPKVDPTGRGPPRPAGERPASRRSHRRGCSRPRAPSARAFAARRWAQREDPRPLNRVADDALLGELALATIPSASHRAARNAIVINRVRRASTPPFSCLRKALQRIPARKHPLARRRRPAPRLRALLDRDREAGCVGAVDGAVVEGDGEAEDRADRDRLLAELVGDDPGAALDRRHAEDRDLGLVDDRRAPRRRRPSRGWKA